MKPHFYVYGFIVLIVFDTWAQVCFKLASIQAEPFTANTSWLLRVLASPWVYGAILGYLGAFMAWMSLLRHVPVGPAFAASHLEIIGVMIVSLPLFGERLTALQWLGALLVIGGVICLAWSESKESRG